jgi:purine-binding chemotaxis protein CheW
MEVTTQLSYLSFRLGDEEFAANVSQVLEILELPSITRIPHAPDYMRGVINLRGKVLPVLDTRVKFRLPVIDDTINTSIVVLRVNIGDTVTDLGAIVDSVEEVMELKEEEMSPPPSIGSYTSFLKGMVRDKDKFVMVLDVDRVFSETEIEDSLKLTGL